jgi:CheY-like chemotaxis protein
MTSQYQNEQQESTKKRILVVDDEPDITFTLKEGLEKSGLFDVETFTDPSSALSNFKSGYYDFLLIDIRMPKIDGYELYDKIRAIDAKVKACFISAYNVNYKALREQFPTIKMECYAKPLEIDELIRKITDELDQN